MKKKQLDKAMKAILDLGPVKHEKPKKPNKEELNKRFKMTFDRSGKLKIKEVKN